MLITCVSPIPKRRKFSSSENPDGRDVPRPSHNGVAIYGSETELFQRSGTDRKDQARRENNSVGKSIGTTGGPKEGKCDLDGIAWHGIDEMIAVVLVSCAQSP